MFWINWWFSGTFEGSKVQQLIAMFVRWRYGACGGWRATSLGERDGVVRDLAMIREHCVVDVVVVDR